MTIKKWKKKNEHLVLDNQGLVYYQLRKYGVNIKKDLNFEIE